MRRNVIVVGASRGGVEAFSQFLRYLPLDLEAAVLLVMHLAPGGPSYLAERLSRLTPLALREAEDGEVLAPGRVYVCVPDRHLMLEGNSLRLSRGPKESHARPSVDVLFRSAAYSVGRRAIGIVLTGQLDDGTAGLWAIKDRGGITITQSPDEAPFPSMPGNALNHVAIDYTLRIDEMADVLLALTREALAPSPESVMSDEKLAAEVRIALAEIALQDHWRRLGNPSFYTCPECHGSMITIEEGPLRRYRCQTGHGFTQGSLCQDGLVQIERTLWSALAQIEEQKTLQLELALQAAAAGKPELEARHRSRLAQIEFFAAETRRLALDPLLSETQA